MSILVEPVDFCPAGELNWTDGKTGPLKIKKAYYNVYISVYYTYTYILY